MMEGEAGRPNKIARNQAAALYKAFDDAAETKPIGGEMVRVWSGFVTQITGTVGIPDGSYRRVVKLLEDKGCIQVVQRGARGYPSVIALLDAPTEDRLESPDTLTRRLDSATVTAQLQDFIESLGGLNIAEAIIEHDSRIRALEATVSKMERANAKKSQ